MKAIIVAGSDYLSDTGSNSDTVDAQACACPLGVWSSSPFDFADCKHADTCWETLYYRA